MLTSHRRRLSANVRCLVGRSGKTCSTPAVPLWSIVQGPPCLQLPWRSGSPPSWARWAPSAATKIINNMQLIAREPEP